MQLLPHRGYARGQRSAPVLALGNEGIDSLEAVQIGEEQPSKEYHIYEPVMIFLLGPRQEVRRYLRHKMCSAGAVRFGHFLELLQNMGSLRLDARPFEGLGQGVFMAGGIQKDIRQTGMAV